VQFVAGPWREDLLLQLGATLESALPWKDRHPALAG
jgi:Asp-tRNA(Asn)/Glu-tRNA(Gln) amidotransferase A subunit family amidase